MIPNANCQKNCDFNQFTIQLNKLIKFQHKNLSRLDSIGAEMRGEIAIIVDIAEAKFTILNALLLQNPKERNFDEAIQNYQVTLKKANDETLESFKNLLDARSAVMENGKKIPLTGEKKEELITTFADDIEKKMNKDFGFNIDASSDLEQLKKDAKQVLDTHLQLHEELLRLKTGIQSELEESTDQKEEIIQIRKEVYSKEVIDVWNACQNGDVEILDQMIKKLWLWQIESFVNQQIGDGWTGLTLASAHGHLKCVKLLLEYKANPNLADVRGYCPLHWAAKRGHKKIAIELINHHASIEVLAEYNRTPLDMAVYNGKENVVKLLISKGANVNVQNFQGCTLLHIAIEQGHLAVLIELFQSPHLNVNLLDSFNHSPIYYAICLGRTDIAALIVGHASWKDPTDLINPNSIANLRNLKPVQNEEGVKKFLDKYK
ncbi:MAG: ankyrin repeat domain-containing protein [Candidatus Protochlamydia sp.]|nr:ankyrin repeat domain-containing protein [Candidatus Protochlamydia sp.]